MYFFHHELNAQFLPFLKILFCINTEIYNKNFDLVHKPAIFGLPYFLSVPIFGFPTFKIKSHSNCEKSF